MPSGEKTKETWKGNLKRRKYTSKRSKRMWKENKASLVLMLRKAAKNPKFNRIRRRALVACWQNPEWVKRWKESRHTPKGQRSGQGHKSEATRKLMSKARKQVLKRPGVKEKLIKHLKTVRNGPSKIQVSIFRTLSAKGISGQRLEFPVLTKSIDIAFPKNKLAIEIDGEYWHQNKSSEKKRNNLLRGLGWSVFHFPAAKKSIPRILNTLKRKLAA